jgi:hypothetical protein
MGVVRTRDVRDMPGFRPGDVVRVRSAAEILSTLDDEASLGGMPFMPEMLKHVGRRFVVSRRVEKICDGVGGPTAARRMQSTVLLEDLRCDGSGHDGCQAGCRLYWREEWLRPDSGDHGESDSGVAELERLSSSATRTTRTVEGKDVERYRCQATQALEASMPLGKYDLRQFAREVTAGNVGLAHLIWVLARTIWHKAMRVLGLRRLLLLPRSTRETRAEPARLDLRPGELVQVKSRLDVAETLSEHGRTRGLSFDPEMVPHCGRTYRVLDRVHRFIEEKTGEMVELSSDCIILDGVPCSGERGIWSFLFCPRGTYPFWREDWLERVETVAHDRDRTDG